MACTTRGKPNKQFSGATICLCLLLALTSCQDDSNEPEPTVDPPALQATPIEETLISKGQHEVRPELPAEPNSKPVAQTVPSLATPRRFTDQFIFPGYAKSDDFSERSKAEQAFDMVFVPGDPEQGIKPFYLSETEIRGGMFWPWALGSGMGWGYDEIKRRLGFYPSEITVLEWSALRFITDMDQQPAIAMSRKIAELYCKTLNEMTGRTYRLPTEAEWDHTLKLGGGVPKDRETLLTIAHLDVEENWLEEPPFSTVPARVGSKKANRLGLHDMLGNAAEWVTQTGERRVVKGGHFQLPPEQLTEDWRAIEDLEVWNATYPQRPVAKSWYRDFYFTGIRLACDADQAPSTPQDPDSPAP